MSGLLAISNDTFLNHWTTSDTTRGLSVENDPAILLGVVLGHLFHA
jgi:hypothetical protein